jgi:hypothetical protein
MTLGPKIKVVKWTQKHLKCYYLRNDYKRNNYEERFKKPLTTLKIKYC